MAAQRFFRRISGGVSALWPFSRSTHSSRGMVSFPTRGSKKGKMPSGSTAKTPQKIVHVPIDSVSKVGSSRLSVSIIDGKQHRMLVIERLQNGMGKLVRVSFDISAAGARSSSTGFYDVGTDAFKNFAGGATGRSIVQDPNFVVKLNNALQKADLGKLQISRIVFE